MFCQSYVPIFYWLEKFTNYLYTRRRKEREYDQQNIVISVLATGSQMVKLWCIKSHTEKSLLVFLTAHFENMLRQFILGLLDNVSNSTRTG